MKTIIYHDYITQVSNKAWAISLELAYYLEKLVEERKPKRILDLGSGFSSYVFSLSDAEVWSVDKSKDWLEKTKQFFLKYKLPVERFILAEDFKFDGKYDLILLDIGLAENRKEYFEKVRKHCSGVVILDDMHFAAYREEAREFFKDCKIIDLKEETIDEFGRYAWMIVFS